MQPKYWGDLGDALAVSVEARAARALANANAYLCANWRNVFVCVRALANAHLYRISAWYVCRRAPRPALTRSAAAALAAYQVLREFNARCAALVAGGGGRRGGGDSNDARVLACLEHVTLCLDVGWSLARLLDALPDAAYAFMPAGACPPAPPHLLCARP